MKNMKRHGFILTEILTGMMLQVGFALVLCGAFYMVLTFSTNTQQGFAANDKGQTVIAYFDSRIRDAGLGLWKCGSSRDIRAALDNISALDHTHTELCLPVAIIDSSNKVSVDRRGKYSGNILTLLYAHRDTNEYDDKPVRLILLNNKGKPKPPLTLNITPNAASNDFILIDDAKGINGNESNPYGITSYMNSSFNKNSIMETTNIKRYAVMENVGMPVYTQHKRDIEPDKSAGDNTLRLQAFTATQAEQPTIYPMTELLNLECQKLYTKQDDNGYNFVFQELNGNGTWGNSYYHTKDILDLYMTLDTRPNTHDRVPIFELRVLVNEGTNEYGTTSRPKDWPGRWKNTGFDQYKVHVSKATWKLYNLAPLFP